MKFIKQSLYFFVAIALAIPQSHAGENNVNLPGSVQGSFYLQAFTTPQNLVYFNLCRQEKSPSKNLHCEKLNGIGYDPKDLQDLQKRLDQDLQQRIEKSGKSDLSINQKALIAGNVLLLGFLTLGFGGLFIGSMILSTTSIGAVGIGLSGGIGVILAWVTAGPVSVYKGAKEYNLNQAIQVERSKNAYLRSLQSLMGKIELPTDGITQKQVINQILADLSTIPGYQLTSLNTLP